MLRICYNEQRFGLWGIDKMIFIIVIIDSRLIKTYLLYEKSEDFLKKKVKF